MLPDAILPALQAIALADDLQVARAAEYIHELLLNALQVDGDATPLTEPVTEMVPLRDAIQQRDALLSDVESVAVARWSLVELTKTPHGQALVQRALADWRDDTQRVGVRLQWTLAGTLILLVATTDIEYGPNGLHIHKKTLIPEQVEATSTFLKAKISMKVFDPTGSAAAPAPGAPASAPGNAQGSPGQG